jgi:ABC-type uncharacterized transport system substrate-binding protein
LRDLCIYFPDQHRRSNQPSGAHYARCFPFDVASKHNGNQFPLGPLRPIPHARPTPRLTIPIIRTDVVRVGRYRFELRIRAREIALVIVRSKRIILAALAACFLATERASAHPHVWVTVRSELVYAADGTITGVHHAWTFDDMFSAFAVQGIEAKKKGEFTREELAPLAQVNIASLKEYDFFTYAKANGRTIEFKEPQVGYYLEFSPKDTALTLHFTLPLKAPLKTKNLVVEVYDPEFFIDFSFAEKNPAKLVGAPLQCKLSVLNPDQMDASLAKQFAQLGADRTDSALTIDSQYANKLVVKCS